MSWVSESDVGLAHDYLLVLRGAERTFGVIADIWPGAPISTFLYDPEATEGRFAGHLVRTSILQGTGVSQASFRKLLPLFPLAARGLSLREHPVVVSSSSAFAHGIKTAPHAVHVCYCHTPFRYAWFEQQRALAEVSPVLRPILAATLAAIRRWDLQATRGVTHYIANSRFTQTRIADFYGRSSTVIHPPVSVERFSNMEPDDYFLTVSEVVPHKLIEVAAQAAVAAGKRLKVAGGGPDLDRLRSVYGRQVDFLGRVDDAQLHNLYGHAQAIVVPNVEEFGIVGVEAQAAGKPVIAAAAGGAMETVVDGVTGQLVPVGDATALEQALRRFDPDRYDADAIQAHAARFSATAFKARMAEVVGEAARRRGELPAGDLLTGSATA